LKNNGENGPSAEGGDRSTYSPKKEVGMEDKQNKKIPNLTTEIAEYAKGIMAKGSRPGVQGKVRA
jgi:hypothetical protein